jgi:hypothetical protein
MPYLNPLVFQGADLGFMSVNSADVRKLYLDPVRSHLLVCLPAMDQSAYDVLRALKPEAKQYLTSLLSLSVNTIVLFHGFTGKNHRDEITRFTVFVQSNVGIYCRYDDNKSKFDTVNASEIRSSLLMGYRGFEKVDSDRCYYAQNGQWSPLPELLYL